MGPPSAHSSVIDTSLAAHEFGGAAHRLNPTHYRLFTFETSVTAAFDTPVLCYLHRFSHADPKPTYKALSYTCGQPYRDWDSAYGSLSSQHEVRSSNPETRPLLFVHDGQRFQLWDVSPNLLDFLLQLRRLGGSRYFWADAICIKQDDLTERAGQVAQISRIYEDAAEVIIWLGPQTMYSESFVEVLNDIVPKLMQILEGRLADGQHINRESLLDTDIVSDGTYKSLQSYARFCLLCNWFGRVWTFQEQRLAVKVKVLCGVDEISWELLMQSLHVLLGLGLDSQLMYSISESRNNPRY